MSEYIVRFSRKQRIEHLVTLVTFVMLCLTGLPQKFYASGWAQGLVSGLGGIDQVRWIHRFFGVVLAVSTVVHFAGALSAIMSKKVPLSMVPRKRDFTDAVQTLRYYLGLTDEHPRYDRFDYKQKFEYWGLVVGNIVMVGTGFILFYPTVAVRLLPGQLVPAAKVAHSNEGLMAFLVIAIWHIFNVTLNPDVFPLDTGIFTGKISRERMLHEHPIELARIEGRGDEEPHGGDAPAQVRREVG